MNNYPDHVLFEEWGRWRRRPGYENLKAKVASTWALVGSRSIHDFMEIELSQQIALLNLAIRGLPDDEQALLDGYYWLRYNGNKRIHKGEIIRRSGLPKTTFYRRLGEARLAAIRRAERIGADWAAQLDTVQV